VSARFSWSGRDGKERISDFKLSPCSECCMLSLGWFPWILCADVSEHSVPKRRHVKLRRRGITQKKAKNRKIPALDWNETPSVWIRASHCGYWANKICGYLDCGMIPVSRLHQANPLLVTDLVSHWTTGWSTLSATRLPKCTLQCAVTFFTALLELWRWGR